MMLDSPLGQLVPLVPGASVDGETQLLILVFALLQVGHHLLGSKRHTNSQQGASVPHRLADTSCLPRRASQYPDDVCKVFALNVVVGLDEDLPEDGLADGVVLSVELVEAVESVAVLRGHSE